jgi:hypothetical protein
MSQGRSWISDALCFFVLGCLGRAVVVHFVDINGGNDGNVEHHSLNFIFQRQHRYKQTNKPVRKYVYY